MRATPLVLPSRALDLWQTVVGQMSWERRAVAAIALLIVRDDELEAVRRRIQRGEIGRTAPCPRGWVYEDEVDGCRILAHEVAL